MTLRLAITTLAKTFPGVKALDAVSLEIRRRRSARASR